MKHLVVTILGALLVAACASPRPSPSPAAPTSGATMSPDDIRPSPTPTAVATPAETVLCVPEVLPSSSPFHGDPCPAAIAAVRAVVQPLGRAIARIVLEPNPFACGNLWPGVGSPAVCFGPMVVPGTWMHGWVRFVGSTEFAAVQVGRPYPQPGSSPSPDSTWTATVVALADPPSGWVMP